MAEAAYAKVLLEGREGIQERPVGGAVRGSAVVVVAEHAQPRQRVADRGVLLLVRCDHALIDGGAMLLTGDARRKQLAFLAGQVWLEVGADLAPDTLNVVQLRFPGTVDADHGLQQATDPWEGLAQAVVVHRDDVLAELSEPDRPPVGAFDVVAGLGGGERPQRCLDVGWAPRPAS